MSSGFILIVLVPPIVVGLRSLEVRRKAAAATFLSRARVVAPLKVTQDYEMVTWTWRFWRWARTVDASRIDDPALLAASASLRKLDRVLAVVAVAILAVVLPLILLYPWRA